MSRFKGWFIILSILGATLLVSLSSYYLSLVRRPLSLAKPLTLPIAKPAEQAELNEQQKIFSDFLIEKKKLPPQSEEVSLIFTGDISFSRAVERLVSKRQDPHYPFLKIYDFLQSADLAFGNLETPITKGREISDYEMVFRSNPGTEEVLKWTGFSILSLANNHTMNFGEAGLKDTLAYLAKAGLKYVGAGQDGIEANQPVYIEVKGIKFAFLAYNDDDVVPASYEAGAGEAGTAFMRPDKMAAAIKDARPKVDFIIVSMHSGTEYVANPNKSQIEFAHAAVDAGADLVIGGHPHVVQTMEKYRGKYIFYSLGNFVFDQPQSANTKEGLALKIYFNKKAVRRILFQPFVMTNLAQPEIASDSESARILERLKFPLAQRAVYAWDGTAGTYKKSARAAVYDDFDGNKGSVSKKQDADLDRDAVLETYSLKNGRLSITVNAKAIWQSPAEWWVDNFILADSNNDGSTDLNLTVWKSGSFGSSQPFWVKENDPRVRNHFFVLDLVKEEIKPVWQSSNLSAPNNEFLIADVNQDGQNELVAIEGDYSQSTGEPGNYVAVWKWNGWGFSNDWRSEAGRFSNLEIEKSNNSNIILVDFKLPVF